MNKHGKNFVESAKDSLKRRPSISWKELPTKHREALKNQIRALESGQITLGAPETVQSFLERLENHYP